MDPVTLALVNGQKGKENGIATLNEFGLHVPAQIPAWFGVFPRTDGWSVPLGVAADVTATRGVVFAVPMVLMRPRLVNRIAVHVVTAGHSDDVIHLGIYSERDRDTRPDNIPTVDLILDAGTVSAATTGQKEIVIDLALQPGVYWLAALATGGSGSSPVVRGVAGFNPMIYGRIVSGFPSLGVAGLKSRTGGYISLPPNNVSANWPNLCDAIASVPYVAVQFGGAVS